MRMPQLHMQSQFARIGIDQKNARLEIKQELPKMHIEQPKAEISITTTPGRLTIDQTEAFADMDLKSILRRNDEFADEALQKLQEGIGRIAREGRELMEIEHGGNAIVEQAKRKGNPPMKRLGITFIPSAFSVKTDYTPAEVELNVNAQKPRIAAEIHKPEFTYVPGHVETYLAVKNELKITVVEPSS